MYCSRLTFQSNLNLLRHYSNMIKGVTMKLSETQMKPFRSPAVKALQELFTKNGFEIRVAGGAVRDIMMNKEPGDLDFATTATPDQMLKFFNEEGVRIFNAGGVKHGTVSGRIEEENFEVTTLRIDKVTDGRHAKVEFITDWELDAQRRDLTVNAMFLSLDGTIFDYFNGRQHLQEGVVSFVGDAETRVKEDYLRILRYFRFYGRIAKIPNNHNRETLDTIKNNLNGLERISGERIWVEVKKIICGRFGIELLLDMKDCGIFPYIGITQDFDVENLKRVCSVCEANGLNLAEFSPSTILAAGFRTQEHCMELVRRVKCSNKEKEVMLFIVQDRDKFLNSDSEKNVLDLYVNFVYKRRKEKHIVKFLLKESLKYSAKTDLLKDFDSITLPVFPVKGEMLFDVVKKKKDYKLHMEKLLDMWIESNYLLSAEELIKKL